MSDFYEIDLLDVESTKSGDAICLRYRFNNLTWIHVVDGGYQETGNTLVNHIRKYYDNPTFIDHVVATHNDADHAGGLRAILENFTVGTLWIHRPWRYAEALISRFDSYSSVEHLRRRLRSIYSNLAALEDIALERRIPIKEPFQGEQIGYFTVMAPSYERFIELVVASEKTPESSSVSPHSQGLAGLLGSVAKKAKILVQSAWANEIFSPNETSAENDMSVVQFASLLDERILLTGDVGRSGLVEAIQYAARLGTHLSGIYRFQVPHHGSRRNVSTEILDYLLGPRLPAKSGELPRFYSYISSAKADKDHPRNSVVRAMYHRGGDVRKTEGQNIAFGKNWPARPDYGPISPVEYPTTQETD
jgi:hypothetical protein